MNEERIMNRFCIFLAILALMPVTALGPASSGAAPNDGIYWTTHVDPRLIEEIVYSDGELLMATSGGLLIYDLAGEEFEQITNSSGLVSNALSALVFDRSGAVWAGTRDAGIMKIALSAAGMQITPLNATFHGLAGDEVTTVAVWGDTIVYGTRTGAGIIFKDVPLTRFTVRNGLPDDYVYDLLVDGDRVFIATAAGVSLLNRSGSIVTVSDGLSDPTVRVLARSDGELWAGTYQGVARFEPSDSSWTGIGLSRKKIYSLHHDGSRLWAGANDSLYVLGGTSWTGYSIKPFLDKFAIGWSAGQRRSEIRAIMHAPDGRLYLGVADYIVDKIGMNPIVFDGVSGWSDRAPNAPGKNVIYRVALDTDGSVWMGTNNYGIGKLAPSGTWLNYNPSTAGGSNLSTRYTINGLLVDRDGTKWISGDFGPVDELHDEYDLNFGNDTWVHHVMRPGVEGELATHRTVRIAEDPAGNRWVLSDGFSWGRPQEEWGIHILSRDTTEWLAVNPLTTGQKMKEGDIFDVAFGPNGLVYVAVREYGVQLWITGGYEKDELFNLSDDIWTTVGAVGGSFASTAGIQSLALTNQGTLWIGTTVGLYRYLNNQFAFIGANRGVGVGLAGANVADLELDSEDNVWVATNLGLNRIAGDDISDILTFTTPAAYQRDLFLYYSDPAKVVSPLANEDCRSLELDRDRNLLYVGTVGGLSVFDIGSITPMETELTAVYVYPNPIRAHSGDAELRIANINSPVTVEIYSMEGELVDNRQADPSDPVAWDLLTSEGFLAASGVYFVKIKDGSGEVIKTVSLIR